jgi:RIO-like serine/threonine protein kinase
MKVKLIEDGRLIFESNRVLSVITMETIKKGFVTEKEIQEHLRIPEDMIKTVVEKLIKDKKIEEIP